MSIQLFHSFIWKRTLLGLEGGLSILLPRKATTTTPGSSLQEWIRRKLLDGPSSTDVPESNTIDTGVLKAVPKKKVSHQKKRQRLYGPGSKQLKMVHHLNECPSCGHYKRANTLCMYCVDSIRRIWKAQSVERLSLIHI